MNKIVTIINIYKMLKLFKNKYNNYKLILIFSNVKIQSKFIISLKIILKK